MCFYLLSTTHIAEKMKSSFLSFIYVGYHLLYSFSLSNRFSLNAGGFCDEADICFSIKQLCGIEFDTNKWKVMVLILLWYNID